MKPIREVVIGDRIGFGPLHFVVAAVHHAMDGVWLYDDAMRAVTRPYDALVPVI